MIWGDEQVPLERYFTLSADDLQLILNARGLAQRLERALMLAWMRVERELTRDVLRCLTLLSRLWPSSWTSHRAS